MRSDADRAAKGNRSRTRRRQDAGAAQECRRLERALRTRGAGNRALLRASAEADLLRDMCQVIVAEGGYRAAFVGYARQDERKTVQPMACVGIEAAFLEAASLTWSETGIGLGPSGSAIRTGRAVIGRHIATDPALASWRVEAHQLGYASASSFPLRVNGEVIGVLTICASEPDAFDEAEAQLLRELAQDLAYGIANLRSRARREEAETQLARVNRALRALSAGNRTLLRAAEEPALLHDMCRVIVEQAGYRMAVVLYAEHDAQKSVRPMAAFGIEPSALQSLPLTWEESGLGLGPTGTAIRTGQQVIGRQVFSDANLAPFYDLAHRQGVAAASAFPLRANGEVIGALAISAAEADAFDEAEVRLLGELAEDLGYGIANLRIRAKHREAQATIERLAHYDPLTGLPNRVLLRSEIEQAIVAARGQRRPLGVLALKVGQFREINDALGYREGDVLLREIAARLARLLKQNEMPARVGEDEFAVLLPARGAEYASALAHRLLTALYEPVTLAGLPVEGRVRIGIALYPGQGTEADALLRRASMAAFQAKGMPAGYAIFAGSLDQECTRRLTLMGELRRAIENNELLLYCQPKVQIASGQVCGAEALVRWPHPTLGMISTGEFVKLAEHAGLIAPLTHWVLDAAFGQAYAWREAGLERPLSVNLSAQDLRDPKLLDRIKGLFATWGTRPESIQFELTESAVMEDAAGALEALKGLKQLGVELHIDDFGTGYSSLSYLQRLPVDSIKIDQSFVANMIASSDSSTIVRSTIELGHNLELEVVAEGVESEAIWTRLAALGCDAAQGYFISRPMLANGFGEWESQSRWHLGNPH